METTLNPRERTAGKLPLGAAPVHTEPETRAGRLIRGEVLLQAMQDGAIPAKTELMSRRVRLTVFDRGEIREIEGRDAVGASLESLSTRTGRCFFPSGSRVAEDAIFFWGGAPSDARPSWMITLFSAYDRFSDIRVYLLA